MRVGNYELRYTPLKADVKDFPYCNKDGELLNKVIPPKPQEVKTYFVDSNGNKYDSAFRLIKGQPRAKLSKTKEVNSFVNVDTKEVEDLLTEKFYFVDCPLLLEKLRAEKKAIKFAFTNGNGYAVYLAYIHTSNLYPNCLFMSLGTAQKSKLITEMIGVVQNQQQKKQLEVELILYSYKTKCIKN